MSVREKTQADFDLEKLFELMDEALTSKDERVQSALRGLLTIIELTRVQEDNKHAIETSHGPLRQMQEDLKHISRRLNNLQEEVRQMKQPPYTPPQPYNPGPGSPFGPYTNPGGLGPIWTTSQSSSSYTLTDNEKDSIMNPVTIKLTK
jgi:TolA-binding protein